MFGVDCYCVTGTTEEVRSRLENRAGQLVMGCNLVTSRNEKKQWVSVLHYSAGL